MKGILPLVAACLAGASPLAAQTVAITNGTLVLGDGSDPIPGGTVVVRNGRIVAAGGGVRVPSNAEVIDANGKWVTPGIVAGFSRLGLAEVDLGADGSDDTETGNSPFSAAIDVATSGLHPLEHAILQDLRRCGHRTGLGVGSIGLAPLNQRSRA